MQSFFARAATGAALVLFAVPAFAGPSSLKVKGQATWLSDAPVERIEGTADGVGELTVDLADLTTLKGTITMPVASMKSGNDTRDDHLKGDDWLQADKHPEIKYEVTSVKVIKAASGDAVKEAEVEVTGNFSLHGETTELVAPATLKWKGDKVKISTAFKVKLADYKVAGKAGIVGKKVGDVIDVNVSLKGIAK